MKRLKEIRRNTYGHDARAINRHSERWYEDAAGNRYVLSCTLDGCPPFFEAYGPFKADHEGLLPRLKVAGQEYWGDGWKWRRALLAFCKELNAVIVNRSSGRKTVTGR
jgi:hypothetical protein